MKFYTQEFAKSKELRSDPNLAQEIAALAVLIKPKGIKLEKVHKLILEEL